MNIEFDNEAVYGNNDQYIKTKIKIYGYKVNKIFTVKKYQNNKLHVNICHW